MENGQSEIKVEGLNGDAAGEEVKNAEPTVDATDDAHVEKVKEEVKEEVEEPKEPEEPEEPSAELLKKIKDQVEVLYFTIFFYNIILVIS